MKVLILSPYPDGLLPALEVFSDEYRVTTEPVTSRYCLEEGFDFLVSYGYRHILKKDLLDLFPFKAANLHISLLPYCRGAHPVFWSILEEKQLGVTIHLLDEGLDTGNILFQQVTPLNLDSSESFATLYQKQCDSIEFLFRYNWKYLRTGECSGWKQQGSPTQHCSRELNNWLGCMPNQWDTLISDFCKLAKIRHHLLCGD
jgi:methionyl-tRNA formyltransferase